MLWKASAWIVGAAFFCICLPSYAQETATVFSVGSNGSGNVFDGQFTSGSDKYSIRFSPRRCFYVEYMKRPKRESALKELLGPIGHIKNGPYASWSTNIAYLSVTGSLKFQSSALVKDTWKLYPAAYDRYDFVLMQESVKPLKFRLSGQYAMNGMKIMSSNKVAHCYRVYIRPEAVLNKVSLNNDGTKSVVLSALAGPELGTVFSLDRLDLKANFYAGVTGALRIDCNVGNSFRFFFEPRFSFVPSSLRYIPREKTMSSFVMRFAAIASLNTGFRISF